MIGKVLRGEKPAGLIYYLYGPGRQEEHTDPHIVAGWRDPAELEPPLRGQGRRDFRRLNGLLTQTLAAAGTRAPGRPVWHCVARAAPTDRMLSDAEWAQVAREIMHRTGLGPHGQEDDAVRWVAIRHAADHIHIVATLARQDGARPRVSNDYYRVREACQAMEKQFGLRATAPADRTATHRPTRAEAEKAHRRGQAEPPRLTLQRLVATAAAATISQEEFFTHLTAAGVLVRKRFSTRTPSEVTGYAVALPTNTTATGAPVWYSGGKLAPDLTLPKLRHRWAHTTPSPAPGTLTAAERAAVWEQAADTAAAAATHIRQAAASGDPAAAADAAWAAAGTLHAAAAALGSRVIRQAATAYDRAARTPYGRIPRPTPTGAHLRRTARLLSAAAYAGHDHTLAQAAFLARLTALADAVATLRRAQQHPAQSAAARYSAERLRAATTSPTPAPFSPVSTSARPVTGLAAASFPHPQPPRPAQPGPTPRPAHRPGAQPGRRPGPSRPRGPGR